MLRRATPSKRVLAPLLRRPNFSVTGFRTTPTQEPCGTLWMICVFAVLVGFVTRLFVFVWLVLVGLAPTGIPIEVVPVVTASSILLLGGGYGSLYQLEQR